MSLETETTIMIALIPFLAIWGLLRLARAVEQRRDDRVARQIALTDAIHRELGAAAAPNVRRTWSGEWVGSMRLAPTRRGPAGPTTPNNNHPSFPPLHPPRPPPPGVALS